MGNEKNRERMFLTYPITVTSCFLRRVRWEARPTSTTTTRNMGGQLPNSVSVVCDTEQEDIHTCYITTKIIDVVHGQCLCL